MSNCKDEQKIFFIQTKTLKNFLNISVNYLIMNLSLLIYILKNNVLL